MAKVKGIGGIFFRTKNPGRTRKWYRDNLGIESENYGYCFQWREKDNMDKEQYTVWTPFPNSTKYFSPSRREFMINFIVDNLFETLYELKEKGVEVLPEIEQSEFGKFGWIIDPDGVKIELWEPLEGG
ncbi:MAG: VOC family protein [Ignavibacteria bacterium]|nr:VOC family protein [Ignavibacteria bacterium]